MRLMILIMDHHHNQQHQEKLNFAARDMGSRFFKKPSIESMLNVPCDMEEGGERGKGVERREGSDGKWQGWEEGNGGKIRRKEE